MKLFFKHCRVLWYTSMYELQHKKKGPQGKAEEITLVPIYTVKLRVNVFVVSVSENGREWSGNFLIRICET